MMAGNGGNLAQMLKRKRTYQSFIRTGAFVESDYASDPSARPTRVNDPFHAIRAFRWAHLARGPLFRLA